MGASSEEVVFRANAEQIGKELAQATAAARKFSKDMADALKMAVAGAPGAANKLGEIAIELGKADAQAKVAKRALMEIGREMEQLSRKAVQTGSSGGILGMFGDMKTAQRAMVSTNLAFMIEDMASQAEAGISGIIRAMSNNVNMMALAMFGPTGVLVSSALTSTAMVGASLMKMGDKSKENFDKAKQATKSWADEMTRLRDRIVESVGGTEKLSRLKDEERFQAVLGPLQQELDPKVRERIRQESMLEEAFQLAGLQAPKNMGKMSPMEIKKIPIPLGIQQADANRISATRFKLAEARKEELRAQQPIDALLARREEEQAKTRDAERRQREEERQKNEAHRIFELLKPAFAKKAELGLRAGENKLSLEQEFSHQIDRSVKPEHRKFLSDPISRMMDEAEGNIAAQAVQDMVMRQGPGGAQKMQARDLHERLKDEQAKLADLRIAAEDPEGDAGVKLSSKEKREIKEQELVVKQISNSADKFLEAARKLERAAERMGIPQLPVNQQQAPQRPLRPFVPPIDPNRQGGVPFGAA